MYAKKGLTVLFAALLTLGATQFSFAAGTEGGTQADPIQAKSSETATIYLGKTITVTNPDKFPLIDDYNFKIQSIRAWNNEAQGADDNGTSVAPENMPQASEKTADHHSVETLSTTTSGVVVGGFQGNANTDVEDTSLAKYRVTPVEITFSKAGYYLYKVTEDASELEAYPGMTYDNNSYYVVVYVCNKTDANGNTVEGVYVHDITSWRNNPETDHQPDLTDIETTTDNEGEPALINNLENYAKVGISTPTPGTDPKSGLDVGPNKLEAFRFYNDQVTHDVVLTNNVTGNLGDLTKEFEFTITLTGLEKNKLYTTNVAAQGKNASAAVGSVTSTSAEMLSTDGGKGTIDSTNKTFTSTANGEATFLVKLADDETFVMNALPATAKYKASLKASNHVASYDSESTEPDTWVMAEPTKANTHSDLALDTDVETVDAIATSESNDGTVTIMFKNHRDIATTTGLPYYGSFVYVLIALVIAGTVIFVIRRRKSSRVEAE